MRERDSLLAAIYDAPDDDAPRMVFADWLDDHGEPARAEFIRLQLRLAPMSEDDPAGKGLRERERELWAANRAAWTADAPKWPGVKVSTQFRRGWPESVTCTGAAFLKHGAKIISRLPLRELSFEKLTPAQCIKVAASSALAGVRTLGLYNEKVLDQGAEVLFNSPHLAGLTSLDLNSTDITAASMKALAESPYLKRLKALALSSNVIYDTGIAQLAEARGWDALREFKGYSMGLSEEAAAYFADAPIFSRLETLEISENWLGDQGAARLVKGKSATWRHLDLGHNQLTDTGAEALARSPRLARLEKLVLRDNAIGVRGVRALANSRHLAHLRELELPYCGPFGDEGAMALAGSPYLRGLVALEVSKAGIGPEGIEALVHSPVLAGVRRLYIDNNPIGPRGARAIAESPHLRHLETLFISDCQLGDEGCLELMRSPNLANVTFLSFDNNDLTDIGAQAILDSPNLKGLTDDLTMDDDGISDEMVRRLNKQFKGVIFFYRPGVSDDDD
jgi:uncharacterized protein (TIGR02996 family)